ncbi:hypothetical protein L9F63_009875 [Diploptera punctata]|uniref:Cyclic nucleotide-binding domain-containing protein n=1 Tax=Diploptera punctata TaxID=6984 RepID=A0AAD8AJC7_DIPPU|nr:hypothetical protein L9F63_009875 [Diploptera punctata]
MCSVLEVTSFTKTIYAHKIAYMRGYLFVHELSPALLEQIWQYMVLLWDILRGTQFPALLAEAPNYLIEGVKTSLFGTHIYSNYVFCTCQVDFLRQIVIRVKQYTYYPGNPIAFKNEINDTMYFIYYGEVEVLIETNDLYNPEVHDVLKEGDAFGVIQGLNPRYGHSNSYRARTYSIILQLYRLDWDYLLESFPDSRVEIYDRADTYQFTV